MIRSARALPLMGAVLALALSFGGAHASDEAGFRAWIDTFKAEARQQNISQATLDRAFAGAKFNTRIVELDSHQPEFAKPIWEYIAGVVTDESLRKARQKLKEHAALLARVRARFGVPPEYVVAIWRIESGFGANFGSFPVIEALATLAYAGRRQDFWKTELIAALRIVDSGEIPLEKLVGSWAGAMGHTQFMPTGFLSLAVDFDGDGRRDIWSSLPDVFASTANHLVKGGWKGNDPFGVEVRLPANFPYELAETTRQPVAEWRKLGVARVDGRPLPPFNGDTAILLPAGHKGPAFLVGENYRALFDYNSAISYALSLGLFAERLRGGGRIVKAWPTGDRQLSRAEKEELQRLLAERGHDPGKIDGQIGPNSRTAIRAFQKKAGMPADGYAEYGLLELVRKTPKP